MRRFIILFCVYFNFIGVLCAYDNGVIPVNTIESAERLVNDLAETYGEKYPRGAEFLQRIDQIKSNPNAEELERLIREAALSNPILDFDNILCVRRKPQRNSVGFTLLNAYTNDTIPRKGWDNEVMMLSNLRTSPKLTPVYKHADTAIIRDLDLHFDGQKFMFASINAKGNWGLFEVGVDGRGLRELTPGDQDDVQWFDGCYLAEEGKILSFSTAGMQGVPCVAGVEKVASLYRVDVGNKVARQLTFEQDSGWHPRLLNDGRVMYLRWQYTETPHYFDRMLFTMCPDGRQQKALWGSGAFFPTAFKHARPVLNHPSMVLGVVSGHHSLPESGRLMLVDPSLGTHYPFRHDPQSKEWGKPGTHSDIYPRVYPKEVTGCVQEIPGWNRDVIGNVYDNQGGDCKYTFAFPFPLNEKYFLTTMQLDHKGTWGIWLVDKFDNMVKLHDLPDAGLFEPVPLIKRNRPNIIPDLTNTIEKNNTQTIAENPTLITNPPTAFAANVPSVNSAADLAKTSPSLAKSADSVVKNSPEGTMFIADVYHGRGLLGIPRGKAKSLRIFSYHFAYWRTGNYTAIGEYSGYDVKRIIGTVPVEADGSAWFKVPANTPLSIQVLDEQGAAIQIMQSWTTVMPNENVSCIGCHENTNEVAPAKNTIAARKPPQNLKYWYGSPRPFAFRNEVQPVLDKYCVGCHNDTNKKETGILSLTPNGNGTWQQDQAYNSLNPFVRRAGTENNIATKKPMEFHASTSELIQRLRRGHYGVNLDHEAWDRLYTWIDLNAPYRGSWNSPKNEARRLELQKLYANLDDNPEQEFRNIAQNKKQIDKNQDQIVALTPAQVVPPNKIKELLKHADDGSRFFHASIGVLPKPIGDNVKAQNFPFKYTEAKKRQNDAKVNGEQWCINDLKFPVSNPAANTGTRVSVGNTTLSVVFYPQSMFNEASYLVFKRIPAGEFVMGSVDGFGDERPRAAVRIEKPFWICETEITNRQYAQFDAEHDTGYEGEHGFDHISPGYIANHPDQPVARVSWREAMQFCEWLSKKTGKKVTLPTEAQWEWATRAGTDQAFYFGHRFADFSYDANLADAGLRKTFQTHEGREWDGVDRQRPANFMAQAGSSLIKHRRYFPVGNLFPLRDDRFTDKWFTVDYVKQYNPNAWGLYDTIGNVWEWTRTNYASYPYNESDGRNDNNLTSKKVVRGGSHSDRPKVIGSAVRLPYEPYQKIHNVGFRPIIEED
ncbi:MAG: SUMF1/EgtB/PvdO family nonheme iron enzyme [Planctomycetaceae bacterium]|jgi:formylglycine-generating enzyme required for sulfatase activity|nr:SUMF1/EgtB/PvdO family nonheme iron enzyme [Planctomycetaceae bacterium]